MCDTTLLTVGGDVPDFELETYDPREGQFGKLSLAEIKSQKKWLILFFYPADFTFVCPTELADLADKYDAIAKAGAEVASVSTDTKFSHLAWYGAEKLIANVRFSMAADPTGKISRMFGVYDHNTGLALRGTFIISPAGKLVSSEVNFYNVGRNAAELLRKIEANAYVATHPEEACPARWKPGDMTLTPSEKLVGRVYKVLRAG